MKPLDSAPDARHVHDLRDDRRRSAERSLTRLDAWQERLEREAARPEDELGLRVEAISGWSLGEQLFHVALANELSLQNCLALANGSGLRVRPFREVHPAARPMLARGTIPRGSAEAPRFVRPPAGVDASILRDILASGRAALAEARARLDEVVAAPDCVPHQLLGDLDAVEWLRFARVHTVHHAAIVRELVRARG